ncbi:LysR family substrate-binding domain-containing protein [Streptomyces sp. AS02]|uniref:LysR family substrate-binding domain-containing protein n=1 Tax=Streptomyces sp. AS02 TaxID=2938946 RepID=UPI0020207360|nr:LysR family substrate-binding domain-containing protein [Streptomyces sp. AS02]MCL8009836.1 LysR family substrate-binding domain-containing protein [Streptomyces sp. AS02]
MTGSEVPPSFRLAYVPGVTPAKWVRIWQERFPDVPLALHSVTAAEAPDVLRAGDADAGFVRLPVDRTVLSAIPLYSETTVVVVPKDHVIAAVDEVTVEDLADEVVFHPLDDVLDWERPPGEPAFERPATTADAVELVAANVGLLVVPQSLARLHHRKDLTYRPLVDGPQSSVALSWPEDATTDQVEDFIGVVRGRTVNSTRGRTTSQAPAAKEQPKRGRPEGGGSARRQPAAGGRSGRGGSGGAKGTKGAKGTRRGKPRNR